MEKIRKKPVEFTNTRFSDMQTNKVYIVYHHEDGKFILLGLFRDFENAQIFRSLKERELNKTEITATAIQTDM